MDSHLMESLGVALDARRAIVVLYVGWSIYPRRAVATLKSAIPQLEPLGITFAVIDEESPDVRAWLDEYGPEFLRDCPRGAGTLLWLENGAMIEVGNGSLTLNELVVRTRNWWASTEPTQPTR